MARGLLAVLLVPAFLQLHLCSAESAPINRPVRRGICPAFMAVSEPDLAEETLLLFLRRNHGHWPGPLPCMRPTQLFDEETGGQVVSEFLRGAQVAPFTLAVGVQRSGLLPPTSTNRAACAVRSACTLISRAPTARTCQVDSWCVWMGDLHQTRTPERSDGTRGDGCPFMLSRPSFFRGKSGTLHAERPHYPIASQKQAGGPCLRLVLNTCVVYAWVTSAAQSMSASLPLSLHRPIRAATGRRFSRVAFELACTAGLAATATANALAFGVGTT
ncbi:hypothetical protein RJ55_02770 [Drechmeria coniospora]|nr:hypothetical protein RJ55_02770 [Drechmeria coniospora]